MNSNAKSGILIDTIMEDAQLLKEKIYALMDKENIIGVRASDTRESINNLLDNLDVINDYIKKK